MTRRTTTGHRAPACPRHAAATATPTAIASAISGTIAITVTLAPGWNLVALSAIPNPPLTAAGLIAAAHTQGTSVEQIARWQNGAWQSHLAAFPANDFPLELGRGYFVRSAGGGQVVLWGRPYLGE